MTTRIIDVHDELQKAIYEIESLRAQLAECQKERDELNREVTMLLERGLARKYAEEELDAAQARIAELERERNHWKANHDNRVAAARALIDRDDLPFERIKAYENYIALQARVAELVDLGVWMTGCGYDFSQHEYFIRHRQALSGADNLEALQAYRDGVIDEIVKSYSPDDSANDFMDKIHALKKGEVK